ncbi:GAF domain-containing protein [Lyngbya sp. PCC 8106]|uniref:GAF domain-containing sensor histidine kinase n=1 Tax=Lyngbya sp. (strain PCC 8106) TaxID=313612 RepID=UPI0000EAAC1A|nr:GAF domain-containing protein [Lyngbya sp. PCC 8106]EAW37125.1 Multi-sensor Signal Transduction Histidine Kinase [Lyngbya sp. PCC 8106]
MENIHSSTTKIDEQHLLYRITKRISQSLELEEILTATVAEVRAFLETDRVMIYQFSADDSGQVMAESIDENHLSSLKGLHFPADDIPTTAREMFRTLGQRSIVNIATGQIGWSPIKTDETENFSISEEINYRSVDPCHIAYLKAMGVQSSLVIPIFHQESLESNRQLWGLLVSHHAEPWEISESQLQLIQMIVDQLSIAIKQSTLLSHTRQQARREATINQVASLLHQQPTIQLQEALEATVKALEGIGGRLYICASEAQTSEVWSCGEQPTMPEWESSPILEEHPLWQHWIKTRFHQPKASQKNLHTDTEVWAITDLYKESLFRVLCPAFVSTKIRGILIVSIQYRQKMLAILSIFRNEIDTEILWAGRFESNLQQILPRQSFETWRELKKGQAQPWIEEEISLAEGLAAQLAMAIEQYLLYKKIQDLNINLEQQVQERTSQLQRTLNFAKALERVTDQIRSTLDLRITMFTIVREVRALIKTDRVLIYKLIDEQEGEVIVEAVGQDISSVLGIKTPSGCFPNNCANQYREGRFGAIGDIYEADLMPCHQEFLESVQVRANLIVPIGVNHQLWGLLIAHECHKPRHWQTEEIDLISQLADQVGIAITQAELYEKTCVAAENEKAKAQQLSQTLEELRQTQTQLIQTEKMSGLGRLVAGIAHEINNPVSFIYGNLAYTSEYSENLLNLLDLYQKHYPQPPAEIQEYAESIELDFMVSDLPKIVSSMRIGADRIRQLVLSLRNFSRLDEAQIKAVNLHEGIDNTLMILQHRFRGNSNFPEIQVVKNYGDLPKVECYASLLNQVFMNIISNALDSLEDHYNKLKNRNLPTSAYSPKVWIETSIIRETSPIKDWVKISILDNGIGVAPEHFHHIFDPFFTTKPIGQGTGLGLSISYQIIVEKHQGRLECISQTEKITEFIISIPIYQS